MMERQRAEGGWRHRLIAIGVTVIVVGIAGCGSSGGSSSGGAVSVARHRGGTLTIARAYEPTAFDPTVGDTNIGSEGPDLQIFDQLVELLPGSVEPQPGLAKSWSVSSDGRVYTFHLRDAKFSNGAPVTSADVAFSLGRLISSKVDPGFAALFSFIKKVDTPNPTTVVLHLSHPANYLLAFLTFTPASILPKQYFEKVGAKRFAQAPVGSGAFVLKSFTRGVKTVLRRNPLYWRTGLPYLNEVDLLNIPDDNTRVLDIRSGQVDIADDISYSQVAPLKQTPGVKVVTRVVANDFFLAFNVRYPPFVPTAARQALEYATPRAAIRHVVFHDLAPIANSILPPMKYWDSTVSPYPYDLAKARQLLASAKLPHGFSINLEIVGTDEASRQTAEILQQSWGQIGVHVTIAKEDFATLIAHVTAEKFQAWLAPPSGGYSDMPVDDELAQTELENLPGSDALWTNYDNKQVNKLVREAVSSASEAQRRRLYAQVQRITMADPPQVTIVFTPSRGAVRSNVVGFDYTTTTLWRLDQVSK